MGQTIGALLCCSLIAVVALWGRSRILVGERSRSFARTAPARQPSVMLDRRQLARLDRELANRGFTAAHSSFTFNGRQVVQIQRLGMVYQVRVLPHGTAASAAEEAIRAVI